MLSLGLERGWRERLVSVLAPKPGERILDVATGTGLVARALRGRAACSVVGVDVTPGMLAAAPGSDGIRFVLGRAERLPFADERFDALTVTYLLRYVEDPGATVRELGRVVRPGGRVASLEFHIPRLLPLRLGWWLYTRIALPLIGRSISAEWGNVGVFLGRSISTFYRRHSLDDVEGMWRAAGFTDVRSRVLGLGAAVVISGTKRGTTPARLSPAFYALAPGGWRDYLTLLHPPYTAWHLSYVVLGAALAPAVHLDRLAGTLLAFFFALGIGVHALDEMRGRPLATRIPSRVLVALGVGGIGAAVALGFLAAALFSPTLVVFVAAGLVLATAYPLELAAGRLHGDLWFAVGWGAFPLLTSYWVNALEPSWAAALGAGYAISLTYAQRRLSTWVRMVRRKATFARAEIVIGDARHEIDARGLIAAPERALRWLTAAAILGAAAALASRLV